MLIIVGYNARLELVVARWRSCCRSPRTHRSRGGARQPGESSQHLDGGHPRPRHCGVSAPTHWTFALDLDAPATHRCLERIIQGNGAVRPPPPPSYPSSGSRRPDARFRKQGHRQAEFIGHVFVSIHTSPPSEHGRANCVRGSKHPPGSPRAILPPPPRAGFEPARARHPRFLRTQPCSSMRTTNVSRTARPRRCQSRSFPANDTSWNCCFVNATAFIARRAPRAGHRAHSLLQLRQIRTRRTSARVSNPGPGVPPSRRYEAAGAGHGSSAKGFTRRRSRGSSTLLARR